MQGMTDNFKCTLDLKGDGGELSLKSGQISEIDTNIHSYGYDGSVTFIVDKESEDKLTFFMESPIIEVTLTIASDRAEDSVKPFELQGFVKNRTMQEFTEGHTPDEIQAWKCEFEFCDPAADIWSRHFRTEIFTEKSMEDVINTYITKPISVKFDSPTIQEKRDLIALGLGESGNTADFYSWLMWHLEETGDIWEYDYAEKEYVIRAAKNPSAEKVDLPCESPHKAFVRREDLSRQNMRIINPNANKDMNKEVEGVEAHEVITRDFNHRTADEKEIEKLMEKIKPKPNTLEHQLTIIFSRYPPVNMFPGNLYTFDDPFWSKKVYFKKDKKSYRLHTLRLTLICDEYVHSEDTSPPVMGYTGKLEGFFEVQDEEVVRRPKFQIPAYPFEFEGKIFSEEGEENEETFNIRVDEETDDLYYTVELPRAEDQKVEAPFLPIYTDGQNYTPYLKKRRVLLHLYPFTAKIVGPLERDKFAEIENKKHKFQRNRIVFGPRNELKAYAFIDHVKEMDGDNKDKYALTTERKSGDLIHRSVMKENINEMSIFKGEEKKPRIHTSMDFKESNYVFYIQGEKADEVQKITLNKKKDEIEILSQKGSDKSTITITPKKCTIKTDELIVETKKTNLTSTDATVCKAKNATFEASQKALMKGGSNITLKAPAIDNSK